MRQMAQRAAILIGACGLAFGALAETTATTTGTSVGSQTATMDKLAANKGQTLVANKSASSFTTLAGSKDNALALVNGLRNGTPITLTGTTAGGATGTSTTTGGTTAGTTGGATGAATTETTITPPTGKMGWGNVFISLALAQKVLTQAGITEPSPAQLQTALMGGELTGADGKTITVKGVLQLRAEGMGWGKIAQVYGTKLGSVVSELRSANKQIADAPPSTTTGATSSAHAAATSKSAPHSAGRSVTTAGGTAGPKGLTSAGGGKVNGSTGIVSASGAAPSGKGVVNAGSGSGHGNAFGKGVVTAAGGNAAGALPAATGNRGAGNAPGAGLVTATGVAATTSAAGLTTAQGSVGHGNGSGNANGNGKGKGG